MFNFCKLCLDFILVGLEVIFLVALRVIWGRKGLVSFLKPRAVEDYKKTTCVDNLVFFMRDSRDFIC